MNSKLSSTIAIVMLLLLLSSSGLVPVESFGINYGQVANNLPPPDKVVALLRSVGITKARIYDTNPQVLTAFAGSGVQLIVTVENEMLATVMDQQQGVDWVTTHIKPYYPSTNITSILVGNEILSPQGSPLAGYLVPAMISIHNALAQLGLGSSIQVSSPNSLAVLSASYPPSSGAFSANLNGVMPQFLQFLQKTGSPFWINAYPYFAYKDDPKTIDLNYALFNPNRGTADPYTKLRYDNMLYAMVDAVTFAIARMGYGGIEVRVSETGWPSKGDGDEIGASPQNAAVYNRNLLRRQLAGEGTPLNSKAGAPAQPGLEVYLFALFNEDMKPGPTSERNYGLFQPDESMVYNVGISTLLKQGTTSTASSASVSFTSSASKQQMGYKGSIGRWWTSSFLCMQLALQLLF